MKMKLSLFALAVLMYGITTAQPVLHNCANYTPGSINKFKRCNAGALLAGNGGAGAIWNFSSLTALPDTLTQRIVLPAGTTYSSLFPGANLVERFSDGSYVYSFTTPGASYMTGFADSASGFTIRYPDSLLFAVRPSFYGAVTTSTFTDKYTTSGYDFSGHGTITMEADGYGTLILPNGTYPNALRIKVTQVQYDTMLATGTVSTSVNVTHMWFDSAHTAELMKIDSGTYNPKKAMYLLHQPPPSVLADVKPVANTFYPNPADGVIAIEAAPGAQLRIINSFGQTVLATTATDKLTRLNTSSLPAGIYCITVQDGKITSVGKLVIQH